MMYIVVDSMNDIVYRGPDEVVALQEFAFATYSGIDLSPILTYEVRA